MRTTDTPTGTLLGDRYVLTRPLGAGASATVYLAQDLSLRREVAVKVLRTGLSTDDAFLRRFRAEAVAVAGLNHPHILSVFDWGEADGDAWLVTEYLPGGSLRDLLDLRGILAPEQVVSIGMQAADGLAYAHSRGFVHRDVKPANLLFDDAGRVRIADFGVARALAEAAWTEPTGGLIGTVRYTSPEQAQGIAVDGKSDVYSLALVLYECLVGEVPFSGDSQAATLHGRVGARLPSHPALGPLADVLAAAAAPEPASRLDASSLLGRLTELARGLPDPAPLRTTKRLATIGFHPPTTAELTGQHRIVAGRPEVAAAPVPDAVVAAPIVPPVTAVPVVAAAPAIADDLTEVRARPVSDATIVAGGAVVRDAPVQSRPQVTSHTKRRWPIVLVVVAVLAAAIVGGVLAFGSSPTPTFVVPSLRGMTVQQAQAVLSHHDATLVVDLPLVTSKTVLAGAIVDQSPLANHKANKGGVVHVTESAGPPAVSLPTVVGMSCSSATTTLTRQGFRASCPATLTAYSPSVPAGHTIAVYYGNTASPSTAPFGAPLAIQLSKGPPPVPVPDVVGQPGTPSVTALEHAGFVVVLGTPEFSTTVPKGNVISTTPAAKVSAQPGTTVTLVVSKGPGVTVPALGLLTFNAAELALISAGLTVTATPKPPGTHEWRTVPAAGTVVAPGTNVVLYLK